MKLKLKSENGFTLVESLISTLLLAIVLTGGIVLYFNSEEIMSVAVHKKIAAEMASARLENLKDENYADIISDTTPTTITVGKFNTQQLLTVVERDDPPGGNPVDYKEVTLNISWTEANQTSPRTIELVTYIAP